MLVILCDYNFGFVVTKNLKWIFFLIISMHCEITQGTSRKYILIRRIFRFLTTNWLDQPINQKIILTLFFFFHVEFSILVAELKEKKSKSPFKTTQSIKINLCAIYTMYLAIWNSISESLKLETGFGWIFRLIFVWYQLASVSL